MASHVGGDHNPWRKLPSPPALMVSLASLRPKSLISPPPVELE